MNKSFTLIEILVVIVIVGILSAFIIIGMAGVSEKAAIAKGQAFAGSLRNSLLINMAGEWKFEGPTAIDGDAVTDDIKDSWGGNNTGITITGTPKIKGGNSCVSGKCLSFNGTTDTVNCGSGGTDLRVSSGSAMAVEAWVNLVDPSRLQSVVSEWTPWILFISSSKMRFYIRSSGADYSVSSNTVLSSNQWHHIAVAYTKSDLSAAFYLNGKRDGNPAFSVTIDNPSSVLLQIGGYGNINTRLGGMVDEVRIYNTAIPISQIQQNYYLGLNNLYKNGRLTQTEYTQRLAELKAGVSQE